MDERDEIRAAVQQATKNLKALADRTPTSPVKSGDLNMLLAGAKRAFPNSATIRGITPVDAGTNMGEVMLKLSLLSGAIQTDFDARIVAESERLDRENPLGDFFRNP
jgi:hypothetical protein